MFRQSKFNLFVFALLITTFVLLTLTVPSISAQFQSDCRDVAGAPIPCTPTPQPPPADRDGDGIIDLRDACPDQPGEPGGNGCPSPTATPIVPTLSITQPPTTADRDGDGVADASDRCPDQPGLPENGGCPSTGQTSSSTLAPTAVPTGLNNISALPSFPKDDFCRVATATTGRVNLRAKPSLNAEVLTTIDPQDNYIVWQAVQNEGNLWYFIEAVNNEWSGYAVVSAMRTSDDCENIEIILLPQPVAPGDITLDAFIWDAPIPVLTLFRFDPDYRGGVYRATNTEDGVDQAGCVLDPEIEMLTCFTPSILLDGIGNVLRIGGTQMLCDLNTHVCHGFSIFVSEVDTCPTALLLPAVQKIREAAARMQTATAGTIPMMVFRDNAIPDPEPPYLPVNFSDTSRTNPCQIDMLALKVTLSDLVVTSLQAAPQKNDAGFMTITLTDVLISSVNADGTPADKVPEFTLSAVILPPELPLNFTAAATPEAGDSTAGGCWNGIGGIGCQAGGNGNYIAFSYYGDGRYCVEGGIGGKSGEYCNF